MSKRNIWFFISLIMILFIAMPEMADAQCAMCKATAEQGDQVGLNLGILYLFLMPYTIVATIAFFWWRNRKKENEMMDASMLN